MKKVAQVVILNFILVIGSFAQDIKVDVKNSKDATVIIGNGNSVTNNKSIIIYQTIQKIIALPKDQSLLFLGFQLSDLRFDSTQSNELKEKYSILNELCLNSIKDDKFYSKNKIKISDLISDIFKLQQKSFKEAFVVKVQRNYDSSRKELFLINLAELKKVNDYDSAQSLLSYFDHTINEAWNVDSNYFLSNLVKENFNLLIDAFAKRIEKSNSSIEVDKLFQLMNSFIQAENFNPKWDYYISLKVSEALKNQFNITKVYLGQLLLEGYKVFLLNKGKFPKKPKIDDVKQVYKYIFPVSDENTLERNVLLAQITLLLQGDLICGQEILDKIQSGWNWAEDVKRLNKIPFLMFKRTLPELKKESQVGDTILTLNNIYYTRRETTIKNFNYKFDKFSKLQRIDEHIGDSIFKDALLKIGKDKYYDNCNLIRFIYYLIS